MPKPYTPTGDTITRDDNSTVYPVVYLDTNGKVAAKAFVPVGHTPQVPDVVDDQRSATIATDTDLKALLADSPGNPPDSLPAGPPQTPFDAIRSIAIDDEHRGDT